MKIKRLLTGVLAGFCAVSAFTFSGCGKAKENVVIYSAAEDYRIEHIRKRMEEQLPDYTPVFQSMNVFVCIFWLFLTGRVHRWLFHAYGGVGLGLSLVWEIVALHGGEIRVEESSERGTTIAVKLPTDMKTK